jgi:hypothetical protein
MPPLLQILDELLILLDLELFHHSRELILHFKHPFSLSHLTLSCLALYLFKYAFQCFYLILFDAIP